MSDSGVQMSEDERRLYKLFKVATPYILQLLRLNASGGGVQVTFDIAEKGHKGTFEVKRRINFQLDD